jgi:hypothetical protein
VGIERPLASCRRSINEGARLYIGTRDGPWYAKPMRKCFAPSWKYILIVSCSADDDVRCSRGTATMLTSDVLHGHARHQRRRFRSLHHLACSWRLPCKEVHAHDTTYTCTSYGSATSACAAQLDRTATRSCIKATNHMRLSVL